MCCHTQRQREELRARRAKRKLDQARLANYKNLYLAARAARDYLKDVLLTSNQPLVAQLNAALVDPHVKQQKD